MKRRLVLLILGVMLGLNIKNIYGTFIGKISGKYSTVYIFKTNSENYILVDEKQLKALID